MRTSNKILLGGFVTAILLIVGVHVILYAKIKNGDLVVLNEFKPEPMERIPAGNIRHVLIKGMQECQIMPGDSAILELLQDWKKHLRYRISGDSLIIDAGFNEAEYAQGKRVYQPVRLYLPPMESITVIYSQVSLPGAGDSAHGISRKLDLLTSQLMLTKKLEQSAAHFQNLVIHAHFTNIFFAEGTVINDLTVKQNTQSILTDEGATVGNFSLQMDSTSSVNLRAAVLDKVKLIK